MGSVGNGACALAGGCGQRRVCSRGGLWATAHVLSRLCSHELMKRALALSFGGGLRLTLRPGGVSTSRRRSCDAAAQAAGRRGGRCAHVEGENGSGGVHDDGRVVGGAAQSLMFALESRGQAFAFARRCRVLGCGCPCEGRVAAQTCESPQGVPSLSVRGALRAKSTGPRRDRLVRARIRNRGETQIPRSPSKSPDSSRFFKSER